MRKEQIITTNNNQMEEKGMKSRFIHFKKRYSVAPRAIVREPDFISITTRFLGDNASSTM